VDIEAVLDRLMVASVSVWLDAEGKLRIDKDAPAELKNLVREHKPAIIDVRRAQDLMNSAGIRIIHLPLGQPALAYTLGTDLDQIRWAMTVLRMDSMPLVLNDEATHWMTWNQWRLRREFWNRARQEAQIRQSETQEQAKLQFGRKTA